MLTHYDFNKFYFLILIIFIIIGNIFTGRMFLQIVAKIFLINFHSLSHLGIGATNKLITSNFIWCNMNKDIQNLYQIIYKM